MANDPSSATTIVVPETEERSSAVAVVDFDLGDGSAQATVRVEEPRPQGAPASGNHVALTVGTELLEYTIERVLGSGGFGIGYLARDRNLQCQVAIKEYLPSDLAVRLSGNTVCPRTDSDTHGYNEGLQRFLAETRVLAGFRHPNIVRVLRFFEANNTAYMVMEYEKGESLGKWLPGRTPLPEAELLRMFLPLLEGLEVVHKSGMLHRDIKPGNIYVRDGDGSLVLLDFGAARSVSGAASRSLTSMVTPGYAPFEQYQTRGEQGPWSDIYAMGAVLYWVVTGEKPLDAPSRIKKDEMRAAVVAGSGRYSEPFLAAIDRALSMDETRRPRSVAEFRAALLGAAAAPAQRAPRPAAAADTEDRTVPLAQERPRRGLLVGGLAAATAAAAVGAYLALSSEPPVAERNAPPKTDVAEAAAPAVAAPQVPAPQEVPQKASPHPAAATRSAPAAPARDKAKAAVPDPAKPVQPAAPAIETAMLSLTVRPSAAKCELRVDGVDMGTVEASRDVKVAPGKHRIELRRLDWPGSYIDWVELKPKESRKVLVTLPSL
ncbi:MAG TPA: serine/threonine-protein kinase [Rhodocyclaceae bacterium]